MSTPLLFILSLIIVLDTSVFQNVNVLAGHMSYCAKISLSPDLGAYYFTSSEIGAERIIYKFQAACNGDTG